MTSVKGDILSALSITTRRVLGGAAISAVLLGAGSGMAFAGDVINTGAGSPTFGDQTNNGLAGDGGLGGDGTSGDAAGEDGGTAAEGGAGGAGGNIGDNAPTQSNSNQQSIVAADQTATIDGDGNTVNQTVNNTSNFYNLQQGANSTVGIMGDNAGDESHDDHAKEDCPDADAGKHHGAAKVSHASSDEGSSSHEGSSSSSSSQQGSSSSSDEGSSSSVSADSSSYASGDNTPVGAADTGDGSFSSVAGTSTLGDEVALGGAISAAALLAAYGVSIARRRVAAHQA